VIISVIIIMAICLLLSHLVIRLLIFIGGACQRVGLSTLNSEYLPAVDPYSSYFCRFLEVWIVS